MFNRKRMVAILGCGPAGMFAAHAFSEAGWSVSIFSKRGKSHMFGAQYLHAPIPGLPEVKSTIEYRLEGTADGYRDKVYGPAGPGGERIEVSPESLVGTHDAWDIRRAYDAAYDLYANRIIPFNLSAHVIKDLLNPSGDCKYIINTVPLPALCDKPEVHKFHHRKIWAAGDAPELGRFSPITCAPDTVVCNGDPERAWYRVSNIFGHTTAEWPEDRRPPLNDLGEVIKPLFHDCDCWAGTKLRPLGRYGAWQKGVLTHHVYEQAKKLAEKRW